jgi:hypothetical protein
LCPVWVFQLLAFHSPPPKIGPLHAASFSYRYLPQRCSGQIATEPSPVDCFAFCFMVSLVSIYFVSFVLFCFDFPLYFVFVGFPCICFNVSLYCFPLFVLCFLVFTVLSIFSAPVSPLSIHCRAFFHAPTVSSFQRILQYTGSLARYRCLFPFFFIVSLLVISLVLIGLLLDVMLGPDLWVVDVSIILAFRTRRTSVGLEFSALSVKK